MNFNYSNIFYYSNNLENLSTLNKYTQNSHLILNTYLTAKNKFIYKKKSNYKTKNHPMRSNGLVKYLVHKPYIFIAPFVGIGFITIIITGLDKLTKLGKHERGKDNPDHSPVNSIELREIHKKPNVQNEPDDENYIMVWNDFLRWEHSPNEQTSVSAPSEIHNLHIPNTTSNDYDDEQLPVLSNELIDSMLNTTDSQSQDYSGDVYQESLLGVSTESKKKDLQVRWSSPTFGVSFLQEYTRGEIAPIGNTSLTRFYTEHELHTVNCWLSQKYAFQKSSMKALHIKKRKFKFLSDTDFYDQFRNYLYQKIFNSSGAVHTPNMSDVYSNIRDILAAYNVNKNTTNDNVNALNTLKKITVFSKTCKPDSDEYFTNNGWFQLPKDEIKRRLKYIGVTQNEYDDIIFQTKQLNDILELLPQTYYSPAYNDNLFIRFSTTDRNLTPDSKYKKAIESISNEVISDLKQVIKRYLLCLDLTNIPMAPSHPLVHREARNFDYVGHLEKTLLVRKNYDMWHVDMSDDDIVCFLSSLDL